MSKTTYGRVLGIFLMLSLAFTGYLMVPAGATVDGMANLKVLVKNQKEENLGSASVFCMNVHTGVRTDMEWSVGEGWFEADVPSGTYQVFAEEEGYVSPAEPQLVYKITPDTDDAPAMIIKLVKIGVETTLRFHVTYDGEDVEGANVHLFGADSAHLNALTSTKGFANFSAPKESLHLLVFSPGMLTSSMIVDANGTMDIEIPLDIEPSSDDGSYRIMGLVKNGTTFVPGLTVKVWDGLNGHLVPVEEADDGALSIPLYPSVFHLLVEADGYEPIWVPSIDLSGSSDYYRPAGNVFEMAKVDTASSLVTTVNMAAGITSPIIKGVWTLDANSRLYGTPNSFGNPRMQSSGYFYTDGWLNVTDVEETAVEESLRSFGPAWIDTTDFFKVNSYAFEADIDGFSVDLTGLEGEVTDQGVNPVVTTTTTYSTEFEYKDDQDLSVEVFTLLDDETVEFILPANYEVLGEFGDKAEFPNDNTSRIIVKEPLEFNAKVKEGPTAKLSFKNAGDFYKVENKKYIVNINENVTLSAASSTDPVGEIVEYYWVLPTTAKVIEGYDEDASEWSEQIIVQFTQNSNLYHNITLDVKDSSGLRSEKKDWILVMPDSVAPVVNNYTLYDLENKVNITVPYVVDEDIDIEFNASDSYDNVDGEDKNGVIVDYIWTFNDKSGSLNGEVVEHLFANPGIYNISLKVVDAVGNENLVANRTITVNDVTKPLAVIMPITDVTQGEKITLNASQSYDPRTTGNLYEDGIANYTWYLYSEGKTYKNQTKIAEGKVTNYTFNTPGSFFLNLTITDKVGLKGWAEKNVFVGGPDLQVRAVTFTDRDLKDLQKGKGTHVSILFANDGEVDCQANWTLKAYYGKDVVKTYKVEQVLKTGKTQYLNFSWKPKTDAEREFKVVLDVDNNVVETTENNNDLEQGLTINEQKTPVQWWYALIIVAIILIIYVAYMKIAKGLWGYEPIMDLINKNKS